MSQCIDHKTTFLDTHRYFRPAIETSRRIPSFWGLELKKTTLSKTKDIWIRSQCNIRNCVSVLDCFEKCQHIRYINVFIWYDAKIHFAYRHRTQSEHRSKHLANTFTSRTNTFTNTFYEHFHWRRNRRASRWNRHDVVQVFVTVFVTMFGDIRKGVLKGARKGAHHMLSYVMFYILSYVIRWYSSTCNMFEHLLRTPGL